MSTKVRYALVFGVAAVAAVFLHELGHVLAAWAQGIAAVPTPAKEYVLRPEVAWHQECGIALGGVLGSTLAALGALIGYGRGRRLNAEAALFGAMVPVWFYTVRFLLVGRGHDGTEWQAAQAALRLAPAGHAIDFLFLGLVLAAAVPWGLRLRAPLRYPLARLAGAVVAGAILLVALQVGNNWLFDRHFPHTQVVGVPSGLNPR
jgi:hypothetical protein